MRNRHEKLRQLKRELKRKREDGHVEPVEPTNDEEDWVEVDEMEVEKPTIHEEEEEFEDEFEDEYEEEEAEQPVQEQQEGEKDWESEQEEPTGSNTEAIQQNSKQKASKDAFVGNNKTLGKGEYLEVENKAYDMLHRMTTEWPCLSIDFVIGENPFDNRSLKFQEMSKYPYEIYTIQGTQAQGNNQLYLTRWSKLHKTKYDDESDDCEDEQDDDIMNDEEPEVEIAYIDTKYAVNRLRTLNSSPIVAFWNENAEITIMDLSKKYRALKQSLKTNPKEKVDKKVYKTSAEGFALNWNPHKIGQLVAGNLSTEVLVYNPNESFTDWTLGAHYHYHKGSVEDIQFSPQEDYAFASCSSDGTIQIVDQRVGDFRKSQLLIKAHTKDVNVIDWNAKASHLLASGSDDCTVKIWDLRMVKQFKQGVFEQLICFSWHDEPITSIAFQPNEESVIAVASQDNRVSVWDLAVENESEDKSIPNELMFVHQGQEEIKQIRYHPILYEMLVSTAASGINAFKPSFAGGDDDSNDDEDDLKRPPIREDQLEDYLNRLSLK